MYKVKITAFLLLLIPLAQAMDTEKMGAITIKNIAENKSVIIPVETSNTEEPSAK